MQYQVVIQEVPTLKLVSRDVAKAAKALTKSVNAQIALGWEPVGGVASVEAGAPHLMQAMIKRR